MKHTCCAARLTGSRAIGSHGALAAAAARPNALAAGCNTKSSIRRTARASCSSKDTVDLLQAAAGPQGKPCSLQGKKPLVLCAQCSKQVYGLLCVLADDAVQWHQFPCITMLTRMYQQNSEQLQQQP
jgi:hypothetical protein